LGSGGNISMLAVLFGAISAAIFGVLSIRFMLNLIARKSLYGFAIYVGILGLAVLFLQVLGILFVPILG
jgi:undecaprenyl pyrophosphate phosphatase UppP